MKNSDIGAIVVIAFVSMLVAYFVADAAIGQSNNESVKVFTVEPITADVQTPDSAIFNKDAINPTVEVVIGDKKTP